MVIPYTIIGECRLCTRPCGIVIRNTSTSDIRRRQINGDDDSGQTGNSPTPTSAVSPFSSGRTAGGYGDRDVCVDTQTAPTRWSAPCYRGSAVRQPSRRQFPQWRTRAAGQRRKRPGKKGLITGFLKPTGTSPVTSLVAPLSPRTPWWLLS